MGDELRTRDSGVESWEWGGIGHGRDRSFIIPSSVS